MSKLHFTSPVEHSQEKCKFLEAAKFWWKNFDSFYHLFDLLSWNFFCLSIKNSLESLSKLHSLCIFRKKKLKHAFLWKTLIFFTSFGLPLEIFRPNQFFFLAQLVKAAFYLAIRNFWGTILSCKIVFSINFRIQWKLLRILMKFPRWGCQNSIIRVQSNNLRKSFAFWKRCIYCQSRTLKEKLSPIFRVFLDAVVETAFYLSKGTLRGKRFFSGKICIFSSIWEIETNFSNFCRNFYGRLIKFALCVSQQTIWG